MPAFPATRPRRNRRTPWLRALVRETSWSPANLIWPVFLTAGPEAEAIPSLPGVVRHPVSALAELAREAEALGIPAIALFPHTPAERRTPDGREALNPDNLVCRAIAEIRSATDAVGVMADVALDPYTSHGHDGLVDAQGRVLNDPTIEVLVGQALNQARAGADILAPSDMMDGRVGAIRRALEAEGFADVHLMAYAAKYASAFYGPFRDAVGAAGRLTGDKRGYQMDPANAREALLEVALDLEEGADSVIVKPGLAYLDVVQKVAERFDVPVFAYCVSGEYAMVEAAVRAGILERDAAVTEVMTAFRRAGARGVLTYHAPHLARLWSA
ncbi:MAG: porphobilinogen synthase [Sphingomonadaceae bacterium]|uniref:porphobilinogen synthase n=1 Tax=Thermaurantiacus sp. TaxID=2820283 RepID=UPI00298F288F|nr:porphobilinogen synthase [Thermaurantiacus sp.]MCS6987468.1 porphobilinogen synthase [Sphingomonadaceae bacterium]MDW8415388.1 porphobilinogen synthase [Thermaurantiacus sp.]